MYVFMHTDTDADGIGSGHVQPDKVVVQDEMRKRYRLLLSSLPPDAVSKREICADHYQIDTTNGRTYYGIVKYISPSEWFSGKVAVSL